MHDIYRLTRLLIQTRMLMHTGTGNIRYKSIMGVVRFNCKERQLQVGSTEIESPT